MITQNSSEKTYGFDGLSKPAESMPSLRRPCGARKRTARLPKIKRDECPKYSPTILTRNATIDQRFS